MKRFSLTFYPRELLVITLALLTVVTYGGYLVGVAHGKAVQQKVCEHLRQEQIAGKSAYPEVEAYQAGCLVYARK